MNDDALPSTASPALADGTSPFVRRTYTILLAVLTGVGLCGFASYRFLLADWVVPVGSADAAMWTIFACFGVRRPVAFVLPVFAAVNGLSLGLLAHSCPDVFLFAAILTLTAFAGLTAFVHYTQRDFSFLESFICAMGFVLLWGCIMVPLSPGRFNHVGYAALGTALFLCWIVYDTGQVIEDADLDTTPGMAAFELLLDLILLNDWMGDLWREIVGRPSDVS